MNNWFWKFWIALTATLIVVNIIAGVTNPVTYVLLAISLAIAVVMAFFEDVFDKMTLGQLKWLFVASCALVAALLAMLMLATIPVWFKVIIAALAGGFAAAIIINNYEPRHTVYVITEKETNDRN